MSIIDLGLFLCLLFYSTCLPFVFLIVAVIEVLKVARADQTLLVNLPYQ